MRIKWIPLNATTNECTVCEVLEALEPQQTVLLVGRQQP